MRSARDTVRLWFSFRVPVGPADYLRHGVALMALKYVVDATVIGLATHTFWSPLDYLNPSYLLREGKLTISPWLRTALVVWTLPFLWIGASMSVRRAVDAGKSAWVGLWFFVPIVNYVLMIVLSTWPSRGVALAPPSDSLAPGERPTVALDNRVTSAMLGLAASVVLGLPLTCVCLFLLKRYGLALFFGTPFIMGMMTGFIHNRRTLRSRGETMLVGTLGMALVGGSLLLFAIEGAVCVAMAFPIAVIVGWMGALFGREIARSAPGRLAHAALAVLALPPLALIEARWPASAPRTYEVVSSLVVEAPPELVWRHVVAFDELPPPHELLFRLGVAYPQRAVIAGAGVGAIRRCEFSTGAFVEPITAWDAPRRLSFDVTSQPDPMRELSPYRNLSPPHLATGFRAVRGEFRLTALPGGRTRLSGSTWYRLAIQPESYWSLWAEGFVGAIHHRVLEHIRREAEAARN